MTSVPSGVSQSRAAEPDPGRASPLIFVAIGMAVLGLAIGAAGYSAKERARRERVALAPIEVPAAVPVAQIAQHGYAGSDAPATIEPGALQRDAGADSANGARERPRTTTTTPPRRRPPSPPPPNGTEF
jgi:hypothetical protein